MHRGPWRGTNGFKIYNPEGLASLSSLRYFRVCGTLSDSLLLVVYPAEPQEHNRQDGAQEVQQVLEATYSSQRDQMTENIFPTTIIGVHAFVSSHRRIDLYPCQLTIK